MWRILAIATRDTVLFLVGVGLLVKELVSKNPDPLVLEIGAGLTGVPGLLHHLALRTGCTPEPIPPQLPVPLPPTDSLNSL